MGGIIIPSLFEVELRTHNTKMKKYKLTNGQIYHLYNRGVEKRRIFNTEADYFRFILGLYEFNNTAPTMNLNRNLFEVRLRTPRKTQMVEIFAFCLMPNHYHLMVRQTIENGITEFMRKLGTGYTNYFNLKNKRVGPLFQGKFKAVLLEKEAHFTHLPHYIHLNPLDLIMPEWREGKIENSKKAISFLKQYRWSSFQDYSGIKNFPSITDREFLTECIGGPNVFLQRMREWMDNKNLEPIKRVTLE